MRIITNWFSLKRKASVILCIRMTLLFTTGNPEERSGLGFAVMQSFMDKVKVSSQPGKGTRVVLTKRLDERST